MIRRPPRSTRTDTLFPYTTLFRSDRNSLGDRMAALSAGTDDAVGWTNNLPEVLARVAGLLRRSRIAAGQLGEGELRIDLIDRRVERAARRIRLPLREFALLPPLARVPASPLPRAPPLPAGGRIYLDPRTTPDMVPMSPVRTQGKPRF